MIQFLDEFFHGLGLECEDVGHPTHTAKQPVISVAHQGAPETFLGDRHPEVAMTQRWPGVVDHAPLCVHNPGVLDREQTAVRVAFHIRQCGVGQGEIRSVHEAQAAFTPAHMPGLLGRREEHTVLQEKRGAVDWPLELLLGLGHHFNKLPQGLLILA